MNEVRWSRAISFGIAIFAVGLGVAFVPVAWRVYHEYAETRITPVIASADLKSILPAVLAQVDLDGMPPPPPLRATASGERFELKLKPLMLTDTTITICEKEPRDLNCTSLTESDFWPPGFPPAIALRVRKELVAANRSSIAVECPASKKVNCGTTESILTASSSWREFYARFPETSGFMRLSNAVLTQDRARALIYLEFRCGQMCASGRLVLLKRNGPEWVVEKQERLWES